MSETPLQFYCPDCGDEKLIIVSEETAEEDRQCKNGHTMTQGMRFPKI